MPLEQTPLRPIQVSYRCDVCGEGHYHHLPNNLCVNPLGLKSVEGWFNKAYIHQCEACGDERIFSEIYPNIRYVREGELLDLSSEIEKNMCVTIFVTPRK